MFLSHHISVWEIIVQNGVYLHHRRPTHEALPRLSWLCQHRNEAKPVALRLAQICELVIPDDVLHRLVPENQDDVHTIAQSTVVVLLHDVGDDAHHGRNPRPTSEHDECQGGGRVEQERGVERAQGRTHFHVWHKLSVLRDMYLVQLLCHRAIFVGLDDEPEDLPVSSVNFGGCGLTTHGITDRCVGSCHI